MLKSLIYACLVFPLVSLSTKAASVDICRILGNGIDAHRNYKTGETLCCKTIACAAGHEAVMCDNDDAFSTSCRVCPIGTYQPDETSSADMQFCHVKKICNGSMRALHRDSSPEMDTICVCDIKQGFCSRSGAIRNPRYCQKQTCPTGLLLKPNCSCVPESNTPKIKSPDTAKPPLEPKVTTTKPPLEPKVTASNGTNGTACRDGSCTGRTGINTPKPVSIDYQYEITEHPPNSYSTQRTIIITVVVCFVVLVVGVLIVAVICKKRHKKEEYKPVAGDSSANSASLDETETGLLEENPARSNGTNGNVLHNPVVVLQMPDNPPNDPPFNEEVSQMAGDTVFSETRNDYEGDDSVRNTSENEADSTKYLMKTTDKEKLTNNLLVLVKNLILCQNFWSLLVTNGTITNEMKGQIMDAPTSQRVSMLIEYLSKRNCHAFRTFLVALIYTKQEHLANTLDHDLTREIKQMCQTDEELQKYIQSLRLISK